MEQWQFLIQQQGDRTWHPLKSPTVEIMEGRYRVVARSRRINTDVDVRITYSSPPEVTPQKRVYKRSRRTNNDGSMAVIPFTYFQPGIWELKCSGDLMSDILGDSWQYLINLEVLSQRVEATEPNLIPNEEEDQIQPNLGSQLGINPVVSNPISSESSLPIPPAPPNLIPVTTEPRCSDQDSVLSSASNITDIVNETSINTAEEGQGAESREQGSREQGAEEKSPHISEINTSEINTSEINTSEINTSEINTDVNQVEIISNHQAVGEISRNQDEDLAINQSSIQLIKSEEDLSLEQPISPVWVQGETAEQILQNLADLALPVEEVFLENKVVEQAIITDIPLPLAIHLEEQAYIGKWGQALTVMGLVQLEATTNQPIDETSEFESVGAAEIRLELRSPDRLQVLAEVKQPLPEKLLPFAIAPTVEIPQNCESKLLLADIYLYGALGGVGEPQLLASQSFIITADVSELLLVDTTKPTALDIFKESQEQFTPHIPEKPPLSIDLELFNLAKTAKDFQSPTFQISPKRSIPLDVETVRTKRTHSRSPQLPFSPQLSLVGNHSASFPYLRKLPLLPSAEETISSNLPDSLPESLPDSFDLILSGDSLDEQGSGEQGAGELELPFIDASNSFEPIPSPKLISGDNPYMSPLIRQWMQNKGYAVPPITRLQPQNYQISLPQITEDVVEELVEVPPTEIQIPDVEKHLPQTWVTGEIVVDDVETEQTDLAESGNSDVSIVNQLPEITSEIQTIQPLPSPELFLSQGELIAGKLVRIRVQLSQALADVAIKLWVEDCQTRWLLDGPHLITDLIENHLGGMEAISEFNIPFGCTEVRVEAIALNLNTQQESHKTSLRRNVIPPDLPSLRLDEILGI